MSRKIVAGGCRVPISTGPTSRIQNFASKIFVGQENKILIQATCEVLSIRTCRTSSTKLIKLAIDCTFDTEYG